MQPLFFDKPYSFITPSRKRFWPWAFCQVLPTYLRKLHGIHQVEYRGVEKIQKSLDAGHAIMMPSNHCRPCDPMVIGGVYRKISDPCYFIAAWHIFEKSRLDRWLIRQAGGFSLNREAVDRASLNYSIDVLKNAERPLVIFPEGAITRSGDRIFPLLEGVSFIARTAARRRAKEISGGKVMVHPVVVKYRFHGDLEATLSPVLSELERRFYWNPQNHLPLAQRVHKLNDARLAAKELEHFGEPQTGSYYQRTLRLIDQILIPLEEEWLAQENSETVLFARCKNIRAAILPDMVQNKVDQEERDRRWRQLADVYDCHSMSTHPEDYLTDNPTPEQLIEIVEKLEEELTDKVRIHSPLSVVVQFDDGVEVDPQRDRNAEVDPLLEHISIRLQTMLDQLNGKNDDQQLLNMHRNQFDRTSIT